MSLNGIDISNWQPNNLSLLKGAGYDFVIVKATEGGPDSAGSIYVDPSFRAKWDAAKAAGLIRGAYHFLRPDLGNTAAGEAQAFINTVGPLLQPGDLVAVDVEKGSGNLAAYVETVMSMIAAAFKFNPMLYVNLDYLRNHGLQGQAALSSYGLWLADWNIPASSIPDIPGWPGGVAIWQNGSAQVPGFPGAVDHDIFFGTHDQLLKYGKPAPITPIDPCQSVKDQLTAAQTKITSLSSQVTSLTGDKNALLAKIAAAKNALG